jgi:hypothetical protein
MKDRNWSYLAGLFDGEGCISICERKDAKGDNAFIFCIQITNTNTDLMKWLVSHFGGVYYSQDGKSRKANWKPSYRWRVKGRKNEEEFLLGVLPYLVVKREQALLALEFVRLFQVKDTTRRLEIATKMRELNRRGISVTTNTLDSEQSEKIESELIGDNESAPTVTLVA